jgi:CHASE2 domain-containing sensor protein
VTVARRRLNPALIAALVATVLSLAVTAVHRRRAALPALDAWEAATVDARFRLRGERAPLDDRIVIVGLDDRTRAEMPELLQTRRGWARLIDALAAARPAAIGVDAFFTVPELNLATAVIAEVRRAAALLAAVPAPTAAEEAAAAALAAVLDETRGDELLGAAIAAAGTVHLAALSELDNGTAT